MDPKTAALFQHSMVRELLDIVLLNADSWNERKAAVLEILQSTETADQQEVAKWLALAGELMP